MTSHNLLTRSASPLINLLMTSCCPHTLPDSDASVIGRGIKSGLERATEVWPARHRLRKARRKLTKTVSKGTRYAEAYIPGVDVDWILRAVPRQVLNVLRHARTYKVRIVEKRTDQS